MMNERRPFGFYLPLAARPTFADRDRRLDVRRIVVRRAASQDEADYDASREATEAPTRNGSAVSTKQ